MCSSTWWTSDHTMDIFQIQKCAYRQHFLMKVHSHDPEVNLLACILLPLTIAALINPKVLHLNVLFGWEGLFFPSETLGLISFQKKPHAFVSSVGSCANVSSLLTSSTFFLSCCAVHHPGTHLKAKSSDSLSVRKRLLG